MQPGELGGTFAPGRECARGSNGLRRKLPTQTPPRAREERRVRARGVRGRRAARGHAPRERNARRELSWV